MSTTFSLTPEAERVANAARLVLVPTSDRDDAYGRARSAALAVAAGRDVTVVLYDRSDERWTDTPHPEGPFAPDEIERDRRPHLVDQMAEFTDAGVTVQAWYASVPALSAIISAVQELDADTILVPEKLHKPRVMDRLQAKGDPEEQIAHVLDQNVERTVHLLVVADDEDRIDATTTVDRTDRPTAAEGRS